MKSILIQNKDYIYVDVFYNKFADNYIIFIS